MKKILILILLLLVGCGQATQPIYADPTEVAIVNLSEATELLVNVETITLVAIVSPSNAEPTVIWSSEDESIAMVDAEGIVTGISQGITTIIATSSVDNTIFDTIEITVYDNQIDLDTIEDIKDYLASFIPSVATGDLNFPLRIGEARLSWQSSDESTISRSGRVNPSRIDEVITLQCVISLSRVEGVFEKNVMVKQYELKPLENKLVTFTYLFDFGTNFKGFREGDLDKIDVINYSFGGIRNGKVSIAGLTHYNQVIKAHEFGVRVVLAIGGWGVGGFSEASRTPETRKVLVDSIIDVIQTHRFDGIDIDWEYPTSTAGGLIVASPQDKQNFTLLLKDLREAMDEIDPGLILSSAVAAGAWAAGNYYEVAEINKYIDYLHVMTYDLINYSTFNTTHHTNMFPSTYSNSSTQAGINAYVSRGMDKSKIVLGIAFYGHRFVTTSEGFNGINATTSARDSVSYQNIVANYLNNPDYTVYYDEAAKASWIYGKNIFISYDDPNSIAYKCQYAIDNELAGVMVWEYCKDSNDSDLLNAIFDNLNPSL